MAKRLYPGGEMPEEVLEVDRHPGGGQPTKSREDDGGEGQEGALSRKGLVETQATARTVLHGNVTGGRSHGLTVTHTTMRMTGGDGGDGRGAHGADRDPRRWSDAKDPDGCDRDVAMIARDVGGDTEARGRAGATKEGGGA